MATHTIDLGNIADVPDLIIKCNGVEFKIPSGTFVAKPATEDE